MGLGRAWLVAHVMKEILLGVAGVGIEIAAGKGFKLFGGGRGVTEV